MPQPLSVQLYTVRDAIAADPTSALERIAAIGFRNVEPYGFVDRVDEYAALLPSLGLSAPTAHARLIGTDPTDTFRAASKLGVRTVIDPMVDASLWTTREDVASTAESLNELAALAADHGLRVGYHNHAWELANHIDGTPALEVLASLLDPAVALEVDTYWAHVGGVPAAELLGRLGNRVVAIHVKDGPINQSNIEQVAVGSGAVPVLDILAAAPDALRVVELDDFDGDVFDALGESFAFLVANGESA